ncbi:molybdenum cofactor biosynthesis protein MoaE [Sphingomonas sp. KC8]|uniref:molybdenum cofactor biosynthesis protein MoaE n=1 Tax=Sphingomonas sp. KC8 TaxID=1030157 RepID=UPI0002489BAE|nr:molybdenum cofactor biosynthesis protein MoaE [Sphingomonas sp. KC8]ARS26548.1 molybdopterin biosynthesis protein MoaE [Sphingomonas sp. KC8]
MRAIRVQAEAFDPGAELARLEALGGGAVASFTGLVRGDGGLIDMTLEHYPAMTTRAMAAIAETAEARWPLIGLTLIHRYGVLVPGDRIVFVGTASSHRAAALESCAFLIDWLKTAAPFWKRERYADGRGAWVEAKAADDEATARWQAR